MIELKKILFPTDFSEPSEEAKLYAISFAKGSRATLYVLTVSQPLNINLSSADPVILHDLDARLESGARENLEHLKEELIREGVQVQIALRRGTPYLEIVKFAEENNIDLIIMGTHGWSGFDHVILGSTTEKVVRKAPCPVLTVKPTARPFAQP